MKVIVICVFLFCAQASQLLAQTDSSALERSTALVEQGIQLYDNEKYTEALALFSRIPPSDPNYSWALYESGLCYWQQDDRARAFEMCSGSHRLNPYDVAVIAAMGSLLDETGKTAEAIEFLQHATSRYPYNANLLYNLAVCYLNGDQALEAELVLHRAIRIRPFHANSHVLLARANHMMGRTAQAYMAYNMGILMSPSTNYLQEFEACVTGTRDSLVKPHMYATGAHNNPYRELSSLLVSEIAFHEKFEYPGALNYLTAKQTYLLFSRLQFVPDDTSLYNQFYVRVFREIMNKNEFNTFLYYSYKGVNNELVSKWVDKNEKQLDEFVEWARDLLFTLRNHAYLIQNERSRTTVMHYNDMNLLVESGGLIAGDPPVRHGNWLIIGKDGRIRERGTYRDNLAEGNWFIFGKNGNVAQHLLFNHDTLHGEIRTYHLNGRLSGIYPRKNGQKEGKEMEYTRGGFPWSEFTYHSNQADGEYTQYNYSEYFVAKGNFRANRPEGSLTEHWLNGQRKVVAAYSDSLLDGPASIWFPSGSCEGVMEYKNNKPIGKWLKYHRNGNLSESSLYDEEGQLTGIRQFYYRDGSLQQTDSAYINGKIKGERLDYFRDGSLSSRQQFRDDTLVGIQSYDASGDLLFADTLRDQSLQIKFFYPDGIIMGEGRMKNNLKEGNWKYYFPNGVLKTDQHYVAGLQDGTFRSFYPDGRLKEEYQMLADKGQGEFREYYPSGKLKKQGSLFEDQHDGEWKTYYENDSLQYSCFLDKGKLRGRGLSYSPLGLAEQEQFFDEQGNLYRLIMYDLEGKVLVDLDEKGDSIVVKEYFKGGPLRRAVTLVDFTLHGKQEFYFPNGKQRLSYHSMHGNVEGTMQIWDPYGRKEMQIPYVKDRIEGPLVYYKNGKLWTIDYYEDHNSQDLYKEYHENGRIYRLMNFVDDKRQGYSTYYSPDSLLMFRLKCDLDFVKEIDYLDNKGNFTKPVLIDRTSKEVVTYYPSGKVSARLSYENGLPHGKHSIFLPNGMIFREFNYNKGKYDGSYKLYGINGKMLLSGHYQEDNRHGSFVYYHPGGQKLREGNYFHGRENGPWDYYDELGRYTETLVYEYGEVVEIRKK